MKETVKKDTGSHWYAKDGTPVFEVPKKRGKGFKKTTVREAREMELFPSVTNVMSYKAKPNISIWETNLAFDVCINNPRLSDETNTIYRERLAKIYNERRTKARDIGSEVHKCIEHFIETKQKITSFDYTTLAIMEPIYTHIEGLGLDGRSEFKVIGNGYGGTIDFLGISKEMGKFILADFKTQETKSNTRISFYDDWAMQLAPYKYAIEQLNIQKLKDIVCCNIVLSSSEPRRIETKFWDNEIISHKFNVFKSLLRTFVLDKKLRHIEQLINV